MLAIVKVVGRLPKLLGPRVTADSSAVSCLQFSLALSPGGISLTKRKVVAIL